MLADGPILTRMLIAIAGGPKTGKTTLANRLARNTLHTDDYIGPDWSSSARVIATMEWPTDLVIEGMLVPTVLRRRLDLKAGVRPVDVLVLLTVSHQTLTPPQHAMALGLSTHLRLLLPRLRQAGTTIVTDPEGLDFCTLAASA